MAPQGSPRRSWMAAGRWLFVSSLAWLATLTSVAAQVAPPSDLPDYMTRSNEIMGPRAVLQGPTVPTPFGRDIEKVAIGFGTGDFVPPKGEKIQPALLNQITPGTSSFYALILLNGGLDKHLSAKLDRLGIDLYGFYPYAAWQARIPMRSLKALAAMPEVRWIGVPSSAQKVGPELVRILADPPGRDTGPLPLFVSLLGPDENGRSRSALTKQGARVGAYDAGLRAYYVEAGPAAIRRVLELNPVLYVEPVPTIRSLSTQAMPSVNADWLWGVYDGVPQDGLAQVKVGILDSGLYWSHTDFSHFPIIAGVSFISGESWNADLGAHGTAVAGILLGAGLAQPRFRGVAAGLQSHPSAAWSDLTVAQVVNQYQSSEGLSVLDGITYMESNAPFSPATDPGKTVWAGGQRHLVNMSFGCSGFNYTGTDVLSRKVDEMFCSNILPVVSAGNEGEAGPSTIDIPGVAKGALTVGAVVSNDTTVWTTDTVHTYSSRGPTGDGRVKPDVVAPSEPIVAAKTGTASGYKTFGGTSAAAPIVTGIAAGIIGRYNTSAWATRAILIASAIDLGWDSAAQGHGKVDAMLAHCPVDGGWTLFKGTNTGKDDVKYMLLLVPRASSLLRVVLVYPDPPATAGSRNPLQNDLDLRLIRGLHRPYAPEPLPVVAWDAASRHDNVEVINVPNVPAGIYTIAVRSYRQRAGTQQPWAVCAEMVFGSLHPTLKLDLTGPDYVKPGDVFELQASATANSYVASGVYAQITPPAEFTWQDWQGLLYQRRSRPSSTVEWIEFNDPLAQTVYGEDYLRNGMNMGDIARNTTRSIKWRWKAACPQGPYTFTFSIRSVIGTGTPAQKTIFVDSGPTFVGSAEAIHWGADLRPDVTKPCSAIGVGLDVNSAAYHFSKDNGQSWSGWITASCTGAFGTKDVQTITAASVDFEQNAIGNMVQFKVRSISGAEAQSSPEYIYTTIVDTVTVTPPIVIGGQNAAGTVKLGMNAPTDGAVVLLSSDSALVVVPVSATVPQGQMTVPFAVTTSVVTAETKVKISATYGGVTMSTTLTLVPVTNDGP